MRLIPLTVQCPICGKPDVCANCWHDNDGVQCDDCGRIAPLSHGDADDVQGWTRGIGEDDSAWCPACSAQIAAEDDGFACEHDAIEWPTAEPPPDDMVSGATVYQHHDGVGCMCTACYSRMVAETAVKVDVIRAAVTAEREEIAVMLEGMADATDYLERGALLSAAEAVRRRAIVRLP